MRYVRYVSGFFSSLLVQKLGTIIKVKKRTAFTSFYTTMLIGYARVSTHDQNLDLQRDALQKAGCEKILVDELSGAKAARPGLQQAMDSLREGDVLVVWRLDRLGRSLRNLLELVAQLEDK